VPDEYGEIEETPAIVAAFDGAPDYAF